MPTVVPLRRGRILRVALDRASANPLYRQIYSSIRSDILTRQLPRGSRLPSTRDLAEDLEVARSTVVLAFEQLRAEGYLTGVPGAATCVSLSVPDEHLHPATVDGPNGMARRRSAPSRRGSAIIEAAQRSAWAIGRTPRAFRVGVPAVDIFPVGQWGRLMARRWAKTNSRQLAYSAPFGYMPLRTAVAEYLRGARGVRCTPEQVLIVAGSQQAIDLCARVLLDPGDRVWMEDPGYHGARGAFIGAGAEVVPVPVDAEGLAVREGIARAPDARLAFVTPSRQQPLGMTMSLARRFELLAWAGEAGWILEDDYDSEFRYASRPLAALQGLDQAGCVLYSGTFSKVMFPSLRLGYLVVPDALVDNFAAARHLTDYHSPYLEQAVMADFMHEGHFERHIRRMRSTYRARQHVLVESARRELNDFLRLDAADAGMSLIGWLHHHDDEALAVMAERAGVDVMPLSRLATGRPVDPGILLGYAGVDESQIRAGIHTLRDVLHRCPPRSNRR
ncbi:MAG: PLP-dependent aminotransferase family protein [Cytophagaceae bacterium]|nr:PLP-dependent aminotransferase family protein [Gemmatimonadaceae bacterium]